MMYVSPDGCTADQTWVPRAHRSGYQRFSRSEARSWPGWDLYGLRKREWFAKVTPRYTPKARPKRKCQMPSAVIKLCIGRLFSSRLADNQAALRKCFLGLSRGDGQPLYGLVCF
jgi:hypothetical protein